LFFERDPESHGYLPDVNLFLCAAYVSVIWQSRLQSALTPGILLYAG
jgi:hypothetical protein